jgi:hypothetical protein
MFLIRERGSVEKLHNKELNDLYSSPNIVRLIKSRKMRWTGHVVRMGERRGVYRVLVGETRGKRNHFGDQGVDARIILKMDLQEVVCGRYGLDRTGPG